MSLDKSLHYTFRIGSDNQHRIFWQDQSWHYEFLAGGVMFDSQIYASDADLTEGLSMLGMSMDQFTIDTEQRGAEYSLNIQKKMKELEAYGIDPCAKHGLTSKNLDGTCEACAHSDFPDDFKGTEG